MKIHSCYIFTGSSVQRAQTSLLKICPAVLNGGMTTFLALVVLADSNSHAFQTFFKVFFLTVVIGMFHGVVFLPVLLSWIGGNNINEISSDDTNSTPMRKYGEQNDSTLCDSNANIKNLSLLDQTFIYITGIKIDSDV